MKNKFVPRDAEYIWSLTDRDDGVSRIYTPFQNTGTGLAGGGSGAGIGITSGVMISLMKEFRTSTLVPGTNETFTFMDFCSGLGANNILSNTAQFHNFIIDRVYLMQGQDAQGITYTSAPTTPTTGGQFTCSVQYTNPSVGGGNTAIWTYSSASASGARFNGIKSNLSAGVSHTLPRALTGDGSHAAGGGFTANDPRSLVVRFQNDEAGGGANINGGVYRVIIVGFEG
jgi:hypothetical protein